VQWSVVIPVKSPARAKSRLVQPATDGAGAALVRALTADTMIAARAADGVARVVAVVDEAGLDVAAADEIHLQARPGLNAALAEAWALCVQRWPGDGVAALLGDLPALRPEELAQALRAAAETPLGYVADAQATGTTLLTARPGSELRPAFGVGSAARHARIATALPGGAGLRRDVDTEADLAAALRLGVGAHTLAVLGARTRDTADEASVDEPHPAQVTPCSPGCDRMAP
jgi:2-phospho-L-lactate/phosphoenolpyruvate guanylyltransferase